MLLQASKALKEVVIQFRQLEVRRKYLCCFVQLIAQDVAVAGQVPGRNNNERASKSLSRKSKGLTDIDRGMTSGMKQIFTAAATENGLSKYQIQARYRIAGADAGLPGGVIRGIKDERGDAMLPSVAGKLAARSDDDRGKLLAARFPQT